MTDAGPTPSARTTSATSTASTTSPTSGAAPAAEPVSSAPVEPVASVAPPQPAAPGQSSKEGLGHTRTSGIWAAVVALVVLLVLLAIFVLQNVQQVSVAYLGWEGEAPLAAALLIATATGALIAVVAGTLRILQLRRRVRRAQRH